MKPGREENVIVPSEEGGVFVFKDKWEVGFLAAHEFEVVIPPGLQITDRETYDKNGLKAHPRKIGVICVAPDVRVSIGDSSESGTSWSKSWSGPMEITEYGAPSIN